MIFLILYVTIAIIFSIVISMAMVEEIKKNGESKRAKGLAGRLLLCLIWPVLIPAGILYAIRLTMKKDS